MSIGFDLDTRGQRERNDSSMLSVGTLDEVTNPGFFAGFGGTAMSTMAHAARSLAIAGGAVPAIADWVVGDDNLSGESLADQYFSAVDAPTKSAVEYWKPSPHAAGVGGRVGGALAGSLVQLAATGGNPSLLILDQQLGTATDLVDQGVDPTTAQVAGSAQGIAAAAGFRLGAYGNTLAKMMASGAAGNLATNVPAAALSEFALEQGGFSDQAKQFNPWDLEARAVDLLLGAAFGGVARLGARADTAAPAQPEAPTARLLPSEADALLSAAEGNHWSVKVAPGDPVGPADMAAHSRAMDTALNQLMRNEPVDVGTQIDGANFRPRGTSGVELIETMRREFGDDFEQAIRQAEPVPDGALIDEGTIPPIESTPISTATPETTRAATEADADLPEIRAARQALGRQGADSLIDVGDETTPQLVSMREAWDQADAEVATARTEANKFMAAVTCFLGG